jgi:hypothetical protein
MEVCMFRLAVMMSALVVIGSAADTSSAPTVTFNKDVLPILERNCQSCHRPGEIGPMSFLTYEGTRPWAKAIRLAVLSRKMPPWFAEAPAGHFANDRRLSDADIETLAAWVDSGAMEGDPKDKPAPVQWKEGWNIQPDVAIEMPAAFDIPAAGALDYTYFLAPVHFNTDTWVTAGEFRPGARGNVHHAIIFVRPPGSTWMKDIQPGVPYVPKNQYINGAKAKPLPTDANEWLVAYVPGMNPLRFDAENSAKLIPAASDLIFEMHYTTNGKATQDRSKVGLVLAKTLPAKRFIELAGAASQGIMIPPGDPNYEGRAVYKFNVAADLIEQQAHMHLRGKDMLTTLTYPTGETQTVLDVPLYNFYWQLVYYDSQPIHITPGTIIEVKGHWDNSANNKNNPDPAATVSWGEQSSDEMMVDHFGVVVDKSADVKHILSPVKEETTDGAKSAPLAGQQARK